MTTLAIESSTPRASLALVCEGELVWESEFTSQRAHNSRIFSPLKEALACCGRNLDRIAVGVGPGSYGGVRVGIAVANGLALALGCQTAGLSSLEAIGDTENFAVVGDARRKSFFLARVREGKLEGEPELLAEDELTRRLVELGGDNPIYTSDESMAERFPRVDVAFPAAPQLARRAAKMAPEDFRKLAGVPLQPHYLRAPYITVPKK